MDALKLIQLIGMLVAAGKVTIDEIQALRHAAGLTDDEMNAVLDGIASDAARRKALADQDAAGS